MLETNSNLQMEWFSPSPGICNIWVRSLVQRCAAFWQRNAEWSSMFGTFEKNTILYWVKQIVSNCHFWSLTLLANKNSGKSTPPCTSFMSLHGKHTEETLAVPAVTVLRCCICWNAWTGSQSSLWHRWGYREGPLWWNSLFVLTFETSGNDWLVGCRFCGYLQGLMQNS